MVLWNYSLYYVCGHPPFCGNKENIIKNKILHFKFFPAGSCDVDGSVGILN